MSGNAALAAARRRRSNQPVQSSGKPGSSNRIDNQNLNQLNNAAEEFMNNRSSIPEKIPISSIVVNHEKRINMLKKDLDKLKLNLDTVLVIPTNEKLDKEVTSSKQSQDFQMKNLTSKIDILENNFNIISDEAKTHGLKINSIEKELNNYKKDIENFKIIFLNINKIINDLKSISDNNTIEISSMRSFLDEHNFVEKTEKLTLSTIKEEPKSIESTSTSENKIEMEIVNM